MSNYVRNYVFCNTELYKELNETDPEKRILSCGIYDLEAIKLRGESWFVIFETRGSEYETNFIKSIINKFTDTTWYCIEENNVEQGEFWFNGKNVELRKRILTQAWDDCLLTILYSDREFRPFLAVFVFSGEIVIEKYIHNKSERISLDLSSSDEVVSFVNHKIEKLTTEKENFKEYTLSEDEEVWEQCWIRKYESDRHILIENGSVELYQEGDPEDGRTLLEEIKKLLERICSGKGINCTFSYRGLCDFI